MVLIAACGGSDEASQVQLIPSPVSEELARDTPPIIDAVETPTQMSITDNSVMNFDALLVPICRNDPFAGSAVGFGTVPRAPETVETLRSDSGDVLPETILALAPVIRWVNHYTVIADRGWGNAKSEEDFAAIIFDESRRVWLACNAISLAVPIIEPSDPGLFANAKGLLSDRQVWLADRLEVLRTDPASIRNDDRNRGEISVGLRRLIFDLDKLMGEVGIEESMTRLPFTVPNPLLGISLDMPGGWMPMRNRIDIVLTAAPELQLDGSRGMGVPGWNFGTALQVRRLRHEEPWTLVDTVNLMDSLLVKFGQRVDEGHVDIASLGAEKRVYESSENGWVTIAAATVHDFYTYLFVLGCPEEDQTSCDVLFHDLLDGVHFDSD